MKFREINARVSGLSSPIFGVSWNPPEAEVAVARRLVSYLEDRRVLYNPGEMEVPEHWIESVLDSRRFLTAPRTPLGQDSELKGCGRVLRAACRTFLDAAGAGGPSEIVRFGAHQSYRGSWELTGLRGNVPGDFGSHFIRLAAQPRLDVEDALEPVFPAPKD